MFVLNVSHVSQRWRQVAITQQSLWTDIIIFLTVRPRLPLEQFLERCGALPINIYIISALGLDEVIVKHLMKLAFKAIAGQAYRWRSFSAHCCGPADMMQVMEGLRDTNTPILENLHLVTGLRPLSVWRLTGATRRTAYTHHDGTRNVLLGSAPSLRSMTLQNTLCLPPTQGVRILNIRNVYSLFSDPYDKLVDALLNNLPLLEDLTIHGAITSLSHLLQFSPSKVSLPALIRLRLLAYDGASKPQLHFLDAISAPLLESVILEDVCYPAVQFLVTTFPQVHTLSIAPGKDVGQDPRALIGRLGSLFPHVRHLAVKALEVAWLPRDYLPPPRAHVPEHGISDRTRAS